MTSSAPMSLRIQAIDHVNLAVGDLARSIEFYRTVLGFEVRESGRRDGCPWAILGAGGRAYVALYEEAGTAPPTRPWFYHWGLVVDDFDAVLPALEAAGIKPRDVAGDPVIEYPGSRSIYIEDPDGHEIELTSRFGGGLE